MSDFDAIKKEMSKLLKEVETLKKEEEIYFDDDLDALKKEMEASLQVVNTSTILTVKKLNVHKINLQKLEKKKIALAHEKFLPQQKDEQSDGVLEELGNEIAKTLKEIAECKRNLRKFKEYKSNEIYGKHKKLIRVERLKKAADDYGVSVSEIFKAEAAYCKKEVIEGTLEALKENEEFLKYQEVLTPEKFEKIAKAGVEYILSNLEKNNSKGREDAKKALQEAGWQFNLAGSPSVAGCPNLYLKLKVLTYRKYLLCKKAMNVVLNDKPLFVLTDFVLAEIKNLTAAAGFVEKQISAHPDAKLLDFKKSIMLEVINDISANHGPWSEGSLKEANKENGRDVGSVLWAPMLAHILHQLMQASTATLAKSRKGCMSMWNFENFACPKVAGFPDDLYPALQQLVYETYKEKIKPLLQPANTNVFMLNHYKTSLQKNSFGNNYPKRFDFVNVFENLTKRVRCM